ncbi:MAG: 5-formyltetrahydrofolate cyclo-ligase, partial [Gammaproteobacteria bacterium]
KAVYLPRIAEDFRLHFARWRPGDPLCENRYGIPEPQAARELAAPDTFDLVIVPLLGFDGTGARLGSGAGYYDRAFEFKREARHARPRLAGYAYALQECAAIGSAVWDVPLDLVVTERGVTRFAPYPDPES